MTEEKNVAIIVETSNGYARGVLRGIHDYSRSRQGWNIYLTEHGRHEIDVSFAGNWRFDGVIARIETDHMARIIKAMNVPTVDVSAARLIEGIPWVETDDEAIARLALDHLTDCGFQNFAFFGDPFYNWSLWRQQAFERLLGRADMIQSRIFNLPVRPEPGVRWWAQREAIRDWLKSLPKPVGILACYDGCGQQLLEICRYYGFKVPQDIAVIGVDNDELLCELATPSMSSVIPNAFRTGAYAAEMLDHMMDGGSHGDNKHSIEPLGVRKRVSTDVLTVGDPHVAKAVAFIRQNAHMNIRVEDVLKIVPLSRRVLETRFREALHRTPHQEILRVRTCAVRELLLETDMSLAEISEVLGIEHPEYLSVFFKKETGLTPREFRDQVRGRSFLQISG
ncbi:LacI family transcriptional regulator [Rhizobium sp. PP-F2F-G38]|uniref:AraC family transcriptional regulator n=1 Tax=Rhizobium sp. PP-CC-3G-465 TaxID=2135648 RepID=UPI000D880668|nr:LacI family transcriptional regulator [Rhizobium sp. PP-WC-1G-195]PYE39508.1 LacI family transcriptional regulator [Rhizobium sp. PP-F2F-G20b]PYE93330.1 LacI family transcriptional regulator [Rhizobium sp. PP-F2F-G38]TCP75613.1 LacI family transcriptional regulator [Rhizobium sp. PP-CC-2G-626]TCQ02543.1 LacI family transcriptional regulator [Rhizobium sp. PP-F2F-G36]TCQ17239.1 LacI family transcriptional regulator [Rhizobium sp. PP-CC-3G-465]